MPSVIHFKANAQPDVVFISTADNGEETEFHIHRAIIASASPFFDAMFALPQPVEEPSIVSSASTPQHVYIPEHAHIMNTVLRLIYPGQAPPIVTLDELTAVLVVAVKYDLTPVIDALRALLLSERFLQMDPVHVYAIACRFSFDEEAKKASWSTLGVNLLDGDEDEMTLPHNSLRHMSAYDYHRLIALQSRRTKAIQSLLEAPQDVKCMYCSGSVHAVSMTPKWWNDWATSAQEDLRRGCRTEKVFSTEYVFEAARKAGCVGCVESVLHAWGFLTKLRGDMDKLPTTI